MAGDHTRGPDLLSIAVLLATFVVIAGTITIGATMLVEPQTTAPLPTMPAGLVFKVPTRAPTPTRFPSPTPAPTSTSAPTPTSLATAVPTATPTETPVAEPSDAVINATVKSVVRLTSSSGSGTAFRVEGTGAPQFVTDSHVVDNVSRVTLIAADGSRHSGSVVRREPAVDLALITAGDLGSIPALSLAPDPPAVGDSLFVVGYGASGQSAVKPAVTRGKVSGQRLIGALDYLQTDAPISQGSSGAPVMSAAGKVLGVAALGLRDQRGSLIQGVTFAIPAGIVQAFLNAAG